MALIDPDMVFMKPLTAKIRSEAILYTNPVRISSVLLVFERPTGGGGRSSSFLLIVWTPVGGLLFSRHLGRHGYLRVPDEDSATPVRSF